MKDYNIYVQANRYEIFNAQYKKIATLYDGTILDALLLAFETSGSTFRIHFGANAVYDM